MPKAIRLLFFASFVLLYGCSHFFPVNIGDILRNPRGYVGIDVTV